MQTSPTLTCSEGIEPVKCFDLTKQFPNLDEIWRQSIIIKTGVLGNFSMFEKYL